MLRWCLIGGFFIRVLSFGNSTLVICFPLWLCITIHRFITEWYDVPVLTGANRYTFFCTFIKFISWTTFTFTISYYHIFYFTRNTFNIIFFITKIIYWITIWTFTFFN